MKPIPLQTDSLLVTGMLNVRYLSGFTGSSGCILLTRRRKYFFTDFRYQRQADREVHSCEIQIVKGGLLAGVCGLIKSRQLKINEIALEYKKLSHAEYLFLRRQLKGAKLSDAGGAVEELRRIKSRTEISKIRRAAAIADEALKKLCRRRVTGSTEREIAWFLESLMRENGSGSIPFDTIVASGPRSAMPHGVAGERVIRPGELVVIDMGASVDGYCCDITRTYATGRLSPGQEKIYRTVMDAQDLALGVAKPGVTCAEVDGAARSRINSAGYGEAFGHSLGHGVGLEAHEGPIISSLSQDVLAEGMTVTIEPGIYTGRNGVRIEDTVLIGAKGAVRLTDSPRELVILR